METNLGGLSGSVNVNFLTSENRNVALTLTGATSIGVAANPPGPCQVTIKVIQSASASSLTWSTAFKWAGGAPPAAGASNGTSIYAFYFDGVNYYGLPLFKVLIIWLVQVMTFSIHGIVFPMAL